MLNSDGLNNNYSDIICWISWIVLRVNIKNDHLMLACPISSPSSMLAIFIFTMTFSPICIKILSARVPQISFPSFILQVYSI